MSNPAFILPGTRKFVRKEARLDIRFCCALERLRLTKGRNSRGQGAGGAAVYAENVTLAVARIGVYSIYGFAY